MRAWLITQSSGVDEETSHLHGMAYIISGLARYPCNAARYARARLPMCALPRKRHQVRLGRVHMGGLQGFAQGRCRTSVYECGGVLQHQRLPQNGQLLPRDALQARVGFKATFLRSNGTNWTRNLNASGIMSPEYQLFADWRSLPGHF